MRIFFHIRDEKPDEWIMEHYYLTKPQLEAFKNLWTAILEPVYKEGLERASDLDWLSHTFAEGYVGGWSMNMLSCVYQLNVQFGRKKSEDEEE
jgi:hypothetical protein